MGVSAVSTAFIGVSVSSRGVAMGPEASRGVAMGPEAPRSVAMGPGASRGIAVVPDGYREVAMVPGIGTTSFHEGEKSFMSISILFLLIMLPLNGGSIPPPLVEGGRWVGGSHPSLVASHGKEFLLYLGLEELKFQIWLNSDQ